MKAEGQDLYGDMFDEGARSSRYTPPLKKF